MRGAALTRRVRFTATHRYHRPEWTEAQNREAFGACAAPAPHRHDYTCDVTVAGDVDAVTGMIIDLGVLDRVLDERVVRALHGKLVNDALPECRAGGLIPTCEVMAQLIALRVADGLASAGAQAAVQTVRVAEDDTLWASWTSDG